MLALAAGRPARAVARWSTRRLRVDRRRLPRRRACPTASSTSCTSARSRPRGPSRARSRTCKALAELGVTTIEVMPVGRVPRRARLGLRRRLPERDPVLLRRPARPAAARRRRPRARPGGDPRRRPQPRRRVRDPGAAGLRAVLHPEAQTPWGAGLNVDDEQCDAVREWVCQSAEGWVRDFHLDGLRLDAIHAIVDSSPEHLVAEIARRVHAARPGALVIAESGPQRPAGDARARARRPRLRRRLGGRLPPRAAHAADRRHRRLVRRVRLARAAGQGLQAPARPRRHLFERSASAASGRPADDVPPERFVVFSADHDQVGNRALGDRLPVETRALAAFCTLLSPFTPMLFQGEEYGERAPFQFFSDHIDPEIADATREGRRREFASFAEFSGERGARSAGRATFERSKLTRSGEPEGMLRAARGAAARPPRAAAAGGRGRGRPSTSGPAGWPSAAASTRCWPTSPARRCTCRASAPRRSCWPRTSRRSSPASSSCPPLAGALVR